MQTIIYKFYLHLRSLLDREDDTELDNFLTKEEQEQLFNIYLKIKTQIFGNDD